MSEQDGLLTAARTLAQNQIDEEDAHLIIDLVARAVAAETALAAVASTLNAMKICPSCIQWARKGDPFCTPHALTLGGLIGDYVLDVPDQPDPDETDDG